LESEAEGTLDQQIEVLTTLTTALLGELELLHLAVAATRIDSNGESEPPTDARQADFRIDFYNEVERYEIALIKRALKHASGNQRRAAELLALNSTTLNAKIKHYGINTGQLNAQYFSRLEAARRPARAHRVLSANNQAKA